MTKYEVLYIISPELEEQTVKETIEKFSALITANGGNVVKVDEWGKRKLAYPIQFKNEGYYVLSHFEGDSALPAELERNFKISDAILRYLVTKIEE